MSFTKFLAATGLAVTLATPSWAERPLDTLEASVATELPNYGFKDVDVRDLSTGQIAHIHHLLYSGKGVADIRGQIGAVLGDSLIRSFFK
ncbi:MAG: hypothetical protein AAF340_14125 [Pseudomonadota bacterium]